MNSLLSIQKLNPLNAEIISPAPLKIINDNKGRSIFLNSTKSINTFAILEIIPGAEIRGNHYHLHKSETMYIIDGKVTLYYWLPDKSEVEETLVESGHLITIKPGLGHAYKAINKTLAFEMGTHPYNPADTIYDYRMMAEI